MKHTTRSEQELKKKIEEIVYDMVNFGGSNVIPYALPWEEEKSEFVHQLMDLIQSEREKVLEEIKIIEPPEDVEKLKDKRQAFIAGQMNIILRAKWLAQKEEK